MFLSGSTVGHQIVGQHKNLTHMRVKILMRQVFVTILSLILDMLTVCLVRQSVSRHIILQNKSTPTSQYLFSILDPCLTSYVRESNWQRSIKYNGSLNTPHHCDTAVAHRWFRFTSKAGTLMPTSCPKPYACGKEFSI